VYCAEVTLKSGFCGAQLSAAEILQQQRGGGDENDNKRERDGSAVVEQ
jgi:hypothetical protein